MVIHQLTPNTGKWYQTGTVPTPKAFPLLLFSGPSPVNQQRAIFSPSSASL